MISESTFPDMNNFVEAIYIVRDDFLFFLRCTFCLGFTRPLRRRPFPKAIIILDRRRRRTAIIVLDGRISAVRIGRIFVRLLGGWPRPFDHGLRRPIEEYQFGKQILFESELQRLANQIDVETKLENPIDVWQLGEHNVRTAAGEEVAEKARRQEHEGGIDTNNSAREYKK